MVKDKLVVFICAPESTEYIKTVAAAFRRHGRPEDTTFLACEKSPADGDPRILPLTDAECAAMPHLQASLMDYFRGPAKRIEIVGFGPTLETLMDVKRVAHQTRWLQGRDTRAVFATHITYADVPALDPALATEVNFRQLRQLRATTRPSG